MVSFVPSWRTNLSTLFWSGEPFTTTKGAVIIASLLLVTFLVEIAALSAEKNINSSSGTVTMNSVLRILKSLDMKKMAMVMHVIIVMIMSIVRHPLGEVMLSIDLNHDVRKNGDISSILSAVLLRANRRFFLWRLFIKKFT